MLVCLLTLQRAEASAPPDLPELLRKLATHAERVEQNEHRLDFVRSETHDELDSDGKVEHGVERVVRVEHPAGQENEVLVKELRDGKDITAETKPRFDEAQARYRELKQKEPQKKDSYRAVSPFKASEQTKYHFELAEEGSRPGEWTLRFRPANGPGKQLMQGTARVNVAAGEAISMKMSPSELPRFTQRADLQLGFNHAGKEPVLQTLHFEGEGGLLFFKKHFRGSTRYDYPGTVPMGD